jgi:hypothetical protein
VVKPRKNLLVHFKNHLHKRDTFAKKLLVPKFAQLSARFYLRVKNFNLNKRLTPVATACHGSASEGKLASDRAIICFCLPFARRKRLTKLAESRLRTRPDFWKSRVVRSVPAPATIVRAQFRQAQKTATTAGVSS